MLQQFPIARWLVVTVTLLMLGVITPAAVDDVADCSQSVNPDLQIRGCTGFIQSGAKGNNLAAAYNNRGNDYRAKGDPELAAAYLKPSSPRFMHGSL